MKKNSFNSYRKKRDFEKTPEPIGEIPHEKRIRFVIQKHQASHLHYDFRLELDGVLKSWAVPKGLPAEAGIKRLAVQVEDHPLDYIDFSGVIPEGNYGAGKVEIWDKGSFKILNRTKDKLVFILEGRKIKGSYSLFHTQGKNWIILKMKKPPRTP